MKRVSRDKTVPVDKRYRIKEPVAEVDLEESFIIETINFRTPIIYSPDDANPKEYKEREETGPIYINGINAGDIIRIHIENIKPVGHASGGWYNDPQQNSFLEIENDKVYFPGGIWARKEMMIGDIYVTPASMVLNPWDNGGNMDFKDICPGNSLCLKAEYAGGLLVLGDVHACQGDGEILGLGAECAADVQIKITKEERFRSERPLIIKQNSYVCIACRESYAEARDLAAADAAKILRELAKITEGEAELYCKTVGDLRNGAVWPMGLKEVHNIPLVVGLEVPTPFLK